MRLNKFLAGAGIASRRASDDIIRAGRVKVNGRVVDRLGLRIDPDADRVTVDDRSVRQQNAYVYGLLHKPRGCLSTVTDPFGRCTVMEYLKDLPHRIFPIGRLDYDTEGVLLFTNDGILGHALIHPRFKVDKVYDVLVQGHPTPDKLRQLERGVPLYGRLTAPAQVSARTRAGNGTWLSITLHEGRKRQIRLMCAYVGYPVKRLRRVRVGPISLGDLPAGGWRYLNEPEIQALRQTVGMDPLA